VLIILILAIINNNNNNNKPYKYLGVLETDRIKMDEMKDRIRKEY